MRRPRVPIAAVALAAVGAGVLVGLTAPSARLIWAFAVAGLVIAGGGRFPPVRTAALLFTLGLGHGRVGRFSDGHSCAARLPGGMVAVAARVAEPTEGGVVADVRLVGAGCRGVVPARFRPGDRVRAGDLVTLRGRWLPFEARAGRARGLLVVHGVERSGAAPGLADGIRNRLHDASRDLYGHRAGLVDALILGRRGGIDPELRAAFARAGLVHILAISGFHVGLIAGWMLLLLRALRVPRHRAAVLATLGVSAYVAFIGAPPSALRAVVLAWVLTLETWRQRRVRPASLFALTGLLLVGFDPFAITELGAWLSVAALAGASAFSRWGDTALGRHGPIRILCGSIGATAATAPVTALVLGTVSLIGIPLNVAAIPIAAVAVPGVLWSLVAHPLARPIAQSAAAGSGVLLDLLEGLASAAARVPGGALDFQAGAVPAVLALLVLGALAGVIAGRATAAEAGRRAAWLVALALALPQAWRAAYPTHAGSVLTLHFLNVGQGDAAVIRTPHGRWVLIDAGPRSDSRDAGRDVVVPFLTRHGVRMLDVLVVSHSHLDHQGGAAAVLDRIGAAVVLEPGRAVVDGAYRAFLDAVDRAGARWSVARSGQRFEVDGVAFEVLHPDTTWAGWGTDLNEDSIVLRVRAGRFEAVLGGDAGLPVESLLRGRVGRAEVLKVGHHGSRTATGSPWLDEIHPRVAVVSVGTNRYGHPAPAALARLDSAGVDVWRTDRDGTIAVVVESTRMQVRGRNRAVWYPLD